MKKDNSLASRMRHQITFQSENPSADTAGGYVLAWTNGATVWAEIKTRFSHSGSEKFSAGQLENRTSYAITTRYISGITPKMRILFGSRVLNIRSVVNLDGKNEILEIFAEEGLAT